MGVLPESARAVLESDGLAHLVTINRDLGGDIVSAHLLEQQKLRNIRRDPRVSLSVETPESNAMGLREYLVIHGRATIEEGGAAELLQELARTYLGPDVVFPPMPDPPPGFRLRIAVERIGGIGPWADGR